MENTLYLFAMLSNGRDLGLFLLVILGAVALGLLAFWLFYGLCSLSAGLSMRLGHTFGLLYFLVAVFFVVRELKEYFVWWHYTPGPTTAVMADAVLIWALSALWLILIWAIWPRPRPALASV